MAIYCGILFVVAWLLETGRLHDGWFFATAVVIVNLMMLRDNCTKRAPKIRAAIQRLFFSLERVALRGR
jgi:hypothetical protein